MIAWTITVPPTVAPGTSITLRSETGNNTYRLSLPEPLDEDRSTQHGVYRYSNEFIASSNGAILRTIKGTTSISASVQLPGEYYTYSTEILGEARTTESWDGQYSALGQDPATSKTGSREIQTTSSETYTQPAALTVTTTTANSTDSTSDGTTVIASGATFASTTSKAFTKVTTTLGDATKTDVFVTTSSEQIVLWGGGGGISGSRATATVIRLDASEVAWVPTTTYFGHELSAFCTSHSGSSQLTILPTPSFREGKTYNGTVTSEAYETITSTVLTTSAEQQSFQNSGVVPSTATEQIIFNTTTTATELRHLQTLAFHSLSMPTTAWIDTTIALSMSELTWQQAIKSYWSGDSKVTTARLNKTTSSFSESGTASNIYDELFTNAQTVTAETKVTWSDVIEPRLQELPTQRATLSAASFYRARAPLSALTQVARQVSASQITYSEQYTVRAAQSAVAASPRTWAYASSGTSITASANAAGLFLTKDTGGTSQTTTSGQWAANGEAYIIRGTRVGEETGNRVLLRALSAATGTAIIVRPAGTYYTTNGTSSGSTSYSQSSALSNQSGNEVSSVAKLWSVGAGQFYSLVLRNETETPPA